MAVYHMIPAMTLRVASSARLGVQALSRAGGAEPVAVVGPLCIGKLGENDDEPLGFDWGYDVFRHTYPLVMTNI